MHLLLNPRDLIHPQGEEEGVRQHPDMGEGGDPWFRNMQHSENGRSYESAVTLLVSGESSVSQCV